MADVATHQDHLGVSRIMNLPPAVDPGEPPTLGQVETLIVAEVAAEVSSVTVLATALAYMAL